MVDECFLHTYKTPGGVELFSDLSSRGIGILLRKLYRAEDKATNAREAFGVGTAMQTMEYRWLIANLLRAQGKALAREWAEWHDKERGY